MELPSLDLRPWVAVTLAFLFLAPASRAQLEEWERVGVGVPARPVMSALFQTESGVWAVARNAPNSGVGDLYRRGGDGEHWARIVPDVQVAAVAGHEAYVARAGELLRSRDGGHTWESEELEWDRTQHLALDEGGRLYATVRRAQDVSIHRLGEGTWTEVFSSPDEWERLRIVPGSSALYLAGRIAEGSDVTERCVLASTDDGDSWGLLDDGRCSDPAYAGGTPHVAYEGGTLVTAYMGTLTAPEVYTSSDGGSSWSGLGTVGSGTSGVRSIGVDHSGALVVGLWFGGAYRYSGGGWQEVKPLGGERVYDLAAVGDTTFYATERGVLRAAGGTWEAVNGGFTRDVGVGEAARVGVRGDVVMASQGGDVYRSADGGSTWALDGAFAGRVGNISVGVGQATALVEQRGYVRRAGSWEPFALPSAPGYITDVVALDDGSYLASSARHYGHDLEHEGQILASADLQTWNVRGDFRVAVTDLAAAGSYVLAEGFVEIGAPLLVSDDAGETWALADEEATRGMSVSASGEILLTPGASVARSPDFGTTWARAVVEPDTWSAAAVRVGETLLASVLDYVDPETSRAALYRSRDDGDTWERWGNWVGGDLLVREFAASEAYVYARTDVGLFRISRDRVAVSSAEGRPPGAVGLTVSPNPALQSATVAFAPVVAGSASLRIYDVLGREVAVLHDGPAVGEVRVQTPDLPAGIYVAALRTAGRVETERFTIVR